MDQDIKLKILLTGQREGVRNTCKTYGISHTLYYRWLHRYETYGLAGLMPKKNKTRPVNKTAASVEATLLKCIEQVPTFGPRALAYELEKQGVAISESAVYNILVRHQLSTRQERLKYVKKRKVANAPPRLDFSKLVSGEGWFFWTTALGEFDTIGLVYIYTFYDFVSHIACSRIYLDLTTDNFEDLLTAVALPISQTLKLNPKHLWVSSQDLLSKKQAKKVHYTLQAMLDHSGYPITLHRKCAPENLDTIESLKTAYTKLLVTKLVRQGTMGLNFAGLKHLLQDCILNYNLEGPLNRHAQAIQSEVILPIWAYMNRDY